MSGRKRHGSLEPAAVALEGRVAEDIGGASGIDHVGILVADADAAATSFRESLGLEVEHDESLPAVGARLVYLSCGRVPNSLGGPCSSTIQLVQPIGSGRLADDLARHGEGLHHVCFSVTVLQAALRRAGEESPQPFLGGKSKRACFLSRRMAGVLVELVEQEQMTPERTGSDD